MAFDSKGPPRGITEEESQRNRLLSRRMRQDARPASAQFAEVLSNPSSVIVIGLMLAVLVALAPATAFGAPVVFAAFCAFVARRRRYDRLPLRLPAAITKIPNWFDDMPSWLRRAFLLPDMKAPVTDYGSPLPGRTAFAPARGGVFIGNENGTGLELWQTPQDFLTHMLLLGTTGAGKTEALVSLFFSALSTGAGGAYTDAKASPKLAMQIFQLLRFLGRDDDFRIISYFTSQLVKPSGTPERISNTNNMFAFGPAELLTQLLTSLIPSSSGDNAIFSQNAETLASALMYPLVWRRDNLKQPLSISVIRAHLNLQKCAELATDAQMPESMRLPLVSFLTGVGWQRDKPLDGQPRSLPEQFGYARGYFNLALAQLTDTYGHIHDTDTGEIDMADIITQRRVMVTMLPALQKSPEQLGMLGKIILSGQRNAAAVGLGARVEGTSADVLDNLPVDTNNIFLAVTDEYGAIPTPGYAEILTQGRGLGVGAIIASQDSSGIIKGDEHAYKQIVENTTQKFIMRVESAMDTWDLVSGVAGDQEIFRTQSMRLGGENPASMGISYRGSRDISVEKVSRVVLQDFQEQIEGEFHLFSRGKLVRGKVFYSSPPLDGRQLRVHRMIPCRTPDVEILSLQYGKLLGLAKTLGEMAAMPEPWADGYWMPFQDTQGNQSEFKRIDEIATIESRMKDSIQNGMNESAIMAIHAFGATDQDDTDNDIDGDDDGGGTPDNGNAGSAVLEKAKAKQESLGRHDARKRQIGEALTDESADALFNLSIRPISEILERSSQPAPDSATEINRSGSAHASGTDETSPPPDPRSQEADKFLEDLTRIDTMAGSEPSVAKENARKVVQVVIDRANDVSYPTQPKPNKKTPAQVSDSADHVARIAERIRRNRKKT